jgi:serine/threonine protein kinase
MPGQMGSVDPSCGSFGSGLRIHQPTIHVGNMALEIGGPTTPEPKLDGTAEVRALLPIGAILQGKYRLDRLLGVGAMGSVFAATHLRNANRVAVKVLHPEFEENSEIRIRFLREGYAANRVRHAGTVRVLDDDIAENGGVFFVMELLEGETLEALWERRARRLPPLEVAQLMCQLLDILSAAHERGIVHRDIKPENLFIERDGTLRVLDFGVARVLEGALNETRPGSVIGTLPYMAPEQMMGKTHEVDARSDVWSVGATAFTLVSGRFVHEAETPEEMLVFTSSRQAPSLARTAPQAPRAFIQVVDRALRFDKSERWPSALAMQTAFAEVCASTRPAEEDFEHEGSERVTLPQVATQQESARFEVPLQPSPAAVGSASHEPAIFATLVSSAESTMRPRPGMLSPATFAMVRAPGANDVVPAPWVPARWVRFAAAAFAFAVAGSIAALTARNYRGRPAALVTVFVQPSMVVPPFASRAAVLVAEADTSGARAMARTPDAQAAANPGLKTFAAAALEQASEAVPAAPKGLAAKPPSPAKLAASLERGPRRQDRSVDLPAPDLCSPPFTIVAVTGKKIWKRECL